MLKAGFIILATAAAYFVTICNGMSKNPPMLSHHYRHPMQMFFPPINYYKRTMEFLLPPPKTTQLLPIAVKNLPLVNRGVLRPILQKPLGVTATNDLRVSPSINQFYRIRTPNTMHPVVHKLYAHLGQGNHPPTVKVLNVKKGQIGKGYIGKNFSYIGALFSRPKQILGAYPRIANKTVAHISATTTTTVAPISNTTSTTTSTEKSISALASLLNIFTDVTPAPHFLPTILPELPINVSTIAIKPSDQTELESSVKIRGPATEEIVWGSRDATVSTKLENSTDSFSHEINASIETSTSSTTSTTDIIVTTTKTSPRSRNFTSRSGNFKKYSATGFRGPKWNTVNNSLSNTTVLPSEVTIVFLPTPLPEWKNETFLPTALPQLTENPNLVNATISNLITNTSIEELDTLNLTTTIAPPVTLSIQNATKSPPPLFKSIRKYQRPSKSTTESPTERPRFSVKEIKKTFHRGFKRLNKKNGLTEIPLKNSEVLSKRGSLHFDNSNSTTIHKARVERVSAPTSSNRFRPSRTRGSTTTETSNVATETSKALKEVKEEPTSNSIDIQVETEAVKDILDSKLPNALLDKKIPELDEVEKIDSPNAKALKIIVEEFQELLSGTTNGPEKHILPIEAFFYSNKID